MSNRPTHPGERAVQQRADEGGPGWGSPMFGPEIPHGFHPFLRAQQMLIVGAALQLTGKARIDWDSERPGLSGGDLLARSAPWPLCGSLRRSAVAWARLL